jgi:hypothetical protein
MQLSCIVALRKSKTTNGMSLSQIWLHARMVDLCVCWYSLCWGDGLGVYNFITKSYWKASNFVTPPKKNLKLKEKFIFFCTYVLSLNLDANFMEIAVLYFASLCLFFRTFYSVFKINFVTKSDKVKIFKKHQITQFFCIKHVQKRKIFKGTVAWDGFLA